MSVWWNAIRVNFAEWRAGRLQGAARAWIARIKRWERVVR